MIDDDDHDDDTAIGTATTANANTGVLPVTVVNTTTVTAGQLNNNNISDDGGGDSRPLTLRLHLVRHGETMANVHNTVSGQTDSPLTELGKQQVMALGNWLSLHTSSSSSSSSLVSAENDDNDCYFWRIYSSDLGRTKHTTQLLVHTYNSGRRDRDRDRNQYRQTPTENEDPSVLLRVHNNNQTIRYDERLREIARGVLQGLPKKCSYEDASMIYTNGQHPLYNSGSSRNNTVRHNATSSTTSTTKTTSSHDLNHVTTTTTTSAAKFPLLETEDDGWDRMYTSWLMELTRDVANHHHHYSRSNRQQQQQQTTMGSVDNNSTNTDCCYNVLVVTHAALLRVFLTRFVLDGHERLPHHQHPEVVYKNDTDNHNNTDTTGSCSAIPTIHNRRLCIPNASLTILKLTVVGMQQQLLPAVPPGTTTHPIIPTVEIERFTSTDHYRYSTTTNDESCANICRVD